MEPQKSFPYNLKKEKKRKLFTPHFNTVFANLIFIIH